MSRITPLALACFSVACLSMDGRAEDSAQNRPYDTTSKFYSTTPRVYSMPPAIHFVHQNQWREYERRQELERQAPLQIHKPLPAYQSPRHYRPPQPYPDPYPQPLQYTGPSHPPEMHEFQDTFSDVVRAHAGKNGGVFVLKDDLTGEIHRLRFLRLHADRIQQLSPSEAFSCADFETVEGPKKAIDLDFYLKKDWDWEVSKVVIHSVNGNARFSSGRASRPAAVKRPPAAAAAAAVIPKPQAPANLSAEVEFHEPSGNGILDGGEAAGLKVTITNAGPGPAYSVKLALDPQTEGEDLSLPSSVEFGDLKAGQSLTKEVPIAASEKIPSQKNSLLLSINEGNGFDTEPALVEFESRAFQQPKLEVAGLTLGGTGVVKAGEPMKISIRIRNAGRGPAKDVTAALKLGSANIFMAAESSMALATLEPGQFKEAVFEFFVNKRHQSGQSLPISLTLTESRGKYGVTEQPLNLVLGKGAPAMKVRDIKASRAVEKAVEEGPEDVDVPPPSKTPINPNAYAVVIGIERYRDVPGVEYAGHDAQTVQAYLTGAMGFSPSNVILLQNERATMTDMATYLGPWLKDRVRDKNSKVFIYYAGHGAPNARTGEGFLIPYDGNPSYTDTTGFPLKQLFETLAELPSGEIMLTLDSCFSGAGGRSLVADGSRPLVAMKKTPALGDNMVVLTASANDQISTYYPEAQHGLLTYFLLKGLRGQADRNKDSRITTAELYAYVHPAVESEARKRHVEQQPTLNPPLDAVGKKGDRVWLRMR